MRRNLLRDVDPTAVAVVRKGANRKRFFMRKTAEEDGPALVLPAPHRLLKAEDWSAVYCVVAEPGWEEDPGVGAPDQSIPDVWADADEIRKAAHRFVKNGGLINKMHEALEPYGDLVESAIAPADFTVIDPDGLPQTIRKDSWYLAIEPNADGRAAIEAGEFTGVSLEGDGMRELVEKAATTGYLCSNCGHFMDTQTARDRASCPECRNRFRNAPMGFLSKSGELLDAITKDALLVPNKPGVTNWIERAGGLPKFLADVAGDLISEKGKSVGNAIQMAIGIIRNWARGQGGVSLKTKAKAIATLAEYNAKRVKAQITKGEGETFDEAEAERLAADPVLIAKADARSAASTERSGSLGFMQDSAVVRFFKRLGERSGMSEEDLAELDELAKSGPLTFGEVIAQREFEDELPDAFSALRDSIWNAFYQPPGSDVDPKELIGKSLDEFKTWSLDLLDNATPDQVQKFADQHADIRKLDEATESLVDGVFDELEKLGEVDEETAAMAWTAEEAEAPERAELVKAARTFSAEQRKKHASKGVALPDGSFPIPDTDALKRAMKAIGRAPKEKRAKVKAHIRRRAKALGATSMLSAAFAKALAKASGAVADRSAAVKQAFAAAHKKYPDGVPKSVSTAIIKDPQGWLKQNGETVKKASAEDVPADLSALGRVASIAELGNVDSEMGLTPEELQRIESLEKQVEEMPGKIVEQLQDPLKEAVTKAVDEAKPSDEEDAKPDAAELKESFEKFQTETTAELKKLGDGIEALGEGDSTQPNDDGGDGGDGDDPAKLRKARLEKAYEDADLPKALAGILE